MPPILTFGFRPFFLVAAVFACFHMLVWVPWFLGLIGSASLYLPHVWHAHELIFGFVPAVIAGFLLTAVPSWTGRQPRTGRQLVVLLALWLSGRVAIASAHVIGELPAALISLLFPVVFLVIIGWDLYVARSLRNLKVWLCLAALLIAQIFFNWEYFDTGRPEIGHRAAVAAIIGLLLIVGSRVTPNFTRNWLKSNNPGAEPPQWGMIDWIASGLAASALVVWALYPWLEGVSFINGSSAVALLWGAAGMSLLVQQSRWQPLRTLGEPLLFVLHIGFAFVATGFVLQALGHAFADFGVSSAALHCWTVGAIGTMSIALMTRATRGHTDRSLAAPWGTTSCYVLIVIAAGTRMASALLPQHTMILLPIAGAAWILAFAGFVALYFTALTGPQFRLDQVKNASP